MAVLGAPVFPHGNLAFFVAIFSEMLLEEKQFQEQVYAAVMKLPEKQAKRIYARYYLGMTVNEIAEVEGVDPSRVRDSIRRGLKRSENIFDKISFDAPVYPIYGNIKVASHPFGKT